MSRRRPLSTKKKLVYAFQYLTLIAGAIFVLVPLWSVFAGSFKTPTEYLNTPRIFGPESFFHLDNYRQVIWPDKPNGTSIIRAFWNTFVVLICSLGFLIVLGSMAGFALGRFQFRGKKWILGAYAVLAVVPGILTPVSTYQVLKLLGVAGSKWSLVVIYSGADIVSLLIFIQFMKHISSEIDDSARIEGANYFQIFFRLILPMLAPAITTVVILRTVGIYNDFVAPFLYASRVGEGTVSMMLFQFIGFNSGTTEAVILAAVVLIILPTLIGFFFVQRYIYAGITQGAVKG
jgi:ABC-type glycerol-3-phosphate transport system permease component